MDIMASELTIIEPGETKVIPTGLKVEIPIGYEIQIRPRSGLSLNTPLRISNSPGTIDSGYRDEIGIIVTNISTSDTSAPLNLATKGNKQGTYIIGVGDRVAQIVLSKVYRIEFIEAALDMTNDRKGGFGSTGV
jgi:dUTP pyrophosphatase